MQLKDLLAELQQVQQNIGADPCFICGGTPRDKYMKRLDNISDLDITNGSKNIDYVSQEFAIQLKKKYNITRKTMEDGHSSIFIGSLKMDFSSNFIVPNIDQYLNKLNVKPDNLLREMYSRDFTCNALLMTLNLTNILDPTKRGFKDIQEKKIKTCLAPNITLTSNKNRVIRAIYLSSKLDFDIDHDIINYVNKNPQVVKISTNKVMTEKLNQAFDRNPQRAVYNLTKMNLWNFVPITEKIYPYYQKYIRK